MPKIWVSFINICSKFMEFTVYISKSYRFLSFNKTVLNQLNSLIYFVIVMNVYVLVDGFSVIYRCDSIIN
jgi:hypothetical protein